MTQAVRELAGAVESVFYGVYTPAERLVRIERLIAAAVKPLVDKAGEASRDYELNERKMLHSTKIALDNELAKWRSE